MNMTWPSCLTSGAQGRNGQQQQVLRSAPLMKRPQLCEHFVSLHQLKYMMHTIIEAMLHKAGCLESAIQAKAVSICLKQCKVQPVP